MSETLLITTQDFSGFGNNRVSGRVGIELQKGSVVKLTGIDLETPGNLIVAASWPHPTDSTRTVEVRDISIPTGLCSAPVSRVK